MLFQAKSNLKSTLKNRFDAKTNIHLLLAPQSLTDVILKRIAGIIPIFSQVGCTNALSQRVP